VVVDLDGHAHLLKDEAHFRTDVLERIDWGNGEVAALDGGPVTQVTAFVVNAGGPAGLFGLDLHAAAGHVGKPGDAVEDEEFWLGAKVGGVAQARGLQEGLGALGDGAGVEVIALAVGRLDDVTGQDKGGLFAKGVHDCGGGVGHEQHVRGFDALPARNRGAVEGMARLKLVLVDLMGGHRDVLLLAAGIGKTEVDELDLVVRDHFQDVFGCGHR